MVPRRPSRGTSKQEFSFKQEEAAPKENFFHGKASRMDDLWVFQVTFNDPDESVLDLDEILMVDFENGPVQSFNARWDDTTIATKKHTEEEMPDFFLGP